MRLCRSILVALLVAHALARGAEAVADLESKLDAALAERWRRAVSLAELYEASGDWQRAVHHYEMARRIRDDDTHVLTQLARIYGEHDARESLLSVYTALTRLQPTSIAWLRELGSTHFRLGHRDEAEAVWQKIVEVQPSKTYALRHLVDIYSSHKLFGKAVAACQQALALSPNDEDLLQRLAEAHHSSGDQLAALAAISQFGIGRSSFRSHRALRLRHNAFIELALPIAARVDLETQLAKGPCSAADLAWTLARSLEKAGEPRSAVPFYRRVATEEPATPRGKAAAEAAVRLGRQPKD